MEKERRRVVEHYPVDRLPEDLREGFEAGAKVQVTVVEETPRRRISLAELVGTGRNVHGSEAEVLAWLRQQRDDDWLGRTE